MYVGFDAQIKQNDLWNKSSSFVCLYYKANKNFSFVCNIV